MNREHSQHRIEGIAGAGFAGFLELFLFHPVDTISKRLINDRSRQLSRASLRQVIFKDAAGKGLAAEISSLYPAFQYAVAYKILQRSLQFGIHPIINSYVRENHESSFRAAVGDRWMRTTIAGVSGVAIGITEVLLLPLDALKVKGQTGVRVMAAGGSLDPSLSASEYRRSTKRSLYQNPRLLLNLYRGASWTAARNSVGTFALFGTSTFIKDQVFNLYDPASPPPSLFHHFTASLSGACASIIVAAPVDVIKVRLQATSLNEKGVSGFVVLRELIQKEGWGALTKGIVPKLLASAPKVTFSFTVAQWLAEWFNRS